MNPTNRAIRAGLIVFFGLVPGLLPAQDFSSATIKTIAVADGIYMLMGPGGNIGVGTGEDGVFVIDDQFAPMTDKITAAIASVTDRPVKMVINTHWHGDHTGGNENFSRAGALIVAHDNVRVRMNSTHISTFFKSETKPAPKAALPVVTFDNTITFHLNGQTIRAEHVPPAHTDGDSIIWFEEANVVHLGDTFFNGLYPFIDVDSRGSVAGIIETVNRVLPRIDQQTKIMPGHGPLTDIKGLTEYRDMLQTVVDRIQAMIDAGKSPQEIVAATPTAEFDAAWGGGFIKPDQWVELLYTVMVRQD